MLGLKIRGVQKTFHSFEHHLIIECASPYSLAIKILIPNIFLSRMFYSKQDVNGQKSGFNHLFCQFSIDLMETAR